MEKINFDCVDNLLKVLPVDLNKIIYKYYDNYCNVCENEMGLCKSCEKYFCMMRRCGNSLCICEMMSGYGFFPYGISPLICPNTMMKQREHYDNCFYQTFHCYNLNVYCYECYNKKIS